jgi:alpha-L-fucosidase 2
VLAWVLPCKPFAAAAETELWYKSAGDNLFMQALPVGNGRLGGISSGNVGRERIVFNEQTLWIGDETSAGAYQAFGTLQVHFRHTNVTNYRRSLDIDRAVHCVEFESRGVRFKRESFASFPDQVLVYRFTASRPGELNGRIELIDAHKGAVGVEPNRLTMEGSTEGLTFGKDAPYDLFLRYRAEVRVANQGGELAVADNAIAFSNAQELLVLIDGGTDFVQDRSRGWRGDMPTEAIRARLDAAQNRSYEDLLARHVADYQPKFRRVGLDLGPGDTTLATDVRHKQQTDSGVPDHGLEALFFQYGRYLTLAASRPGGLPANLQGLWNDSNQPKWRGDYHTDINIEMNYWPTDVANLSESFEPFARWLFSIRDVRKEDTLSRTGIKRGWTMRPENGLFGGSSWAEVETGSAWCMQNVWEHYAFTHDVEYLRTLAYPMMKETSEFWCDRLKALPDGKLVAPKGLSPEHGPRQDGVSHDQQLIWELFTSTIEAAGILGVDAAWAAELQEKRDRLVGPQVGRWGQLQEWMVDRDDPEDKHRHLSHLVGLYPGRQITPQDTPEWAEAARVSLDARGNDGTGWSCAWKIALWARLHDGKRAYTLLRSLMRYTMAGGVNYVTGGGVYPNLLAAHPPFQIDANFGYVAGVCEMLLQSHRNEIHLLPALPPAWPWGHVTGLRARGGYVVDVAWKDHKVTSFRIASAKPRPVAVRVNGEVKTITPEAL